MRLSGTAGRHPRPGGSRRPCRSAVVEISQPARHSIDTSAAPRRTVQSDAANRPGPRRARPPHVRARRGAPPVCDKLPPAPSQGEGHAPNRQPGAAAAAGKTSGQAAPNRPGCMDAGRGRLRSGGVAQSMRPGATPTPDDAPNHATRTSLPNPRPAEADQLRIVAVGAPERQQPLRRLQWHIPSTKHATTPRPQHRAHLNDTLRSRQDNISHAYAGQYSQLQIGAGQNSAAQGQRRTGCRRKGSRRTCAGLRSRRAQSNLRRRCEFRASVPTYIRAPSGQPYASQRRSTHTGRTQHPAEQCGAARRAGGRRRTRATVASTMPLQHA